VTSAIASRRVHPSEVSANVALSMRSRWSRKLQPSRTGIDGTPRPQPNDRKP
jgi:hypothetical protein